MSSLHEVWHCQEAHHLEGFFLHSLSIKAIHFCYFTTKWKQFHWWNSEFLALASKDTGSSSMILFLISVLCRISLSSFLNGTLVNFWGIMGGNSLKYEVALSGWWDFCFVPTQIEACLNSRPCGGLYTRPFSLLSSPWTFARFILLPIYHIALLMLVDVGLVTSANSIIPLRVLV